MKTFTVRAVVLACVALAFATMPVAAQELLKLRFGKLGPNLGMARAEIAESQGFFKKHGLNVEVTQFRASPELNTAVVSGAIDIALSGITSVLTGRQRGLPLKAFFVETVAPFYYLLASPDIESMKDAVAKGAAAGVSGIGSLDYTITRYLFKRAGLDPDKIKYIQAGTPAQRTAALEAGRVQIAISVVPEKYAVLRRGKVREIARMSDYSKNFALETFWGREDYLAGNTEAVRRFLAAMDDTAQWIRTSPEAPDVLAMFIGFAYPEAAADVKEALREVNYPTVAEHKARLDELLIGAEPLAEDALERGILKADNAHALVEQIFDLRYVK
jgi:ABC-type nitrate/sulfonate/bicarbonate transport system substrate-binding protein